MARNKKVAERTSATLATGTKITGSKELVDKVKARASAAAKVAAK